MVAPIIPSPVERVLDAADALQLSPKPTSSGFMMRCPAHADRTPSLSVTEGDDGRALVHCHANAGCSYDQIRDALGLTDADMHPQKGASVGAHKRPATPRETTRSKAPTVHGNRWRKAQNRFAPGATWHEYQDSDGSVVLMVGRVEATHDSGKRFVQLSVNPETSEPEAKCHLQTLPLYRLPQLNKARPEKWVLVVEGEKCVGRVDARMDWPATTSAGGANAARKTDWNPLRGRRVAILPDHDEPGRAYAANVAELLRAAGALEVRVVELDNPDNVKGWDIADWLAARADAKPKELREELQDLIDNTPTSRVTFDDAAPMQQQERPAMAEPPTPLPVSQRRRVTLRDADEVAAMPVPEWRVLNVLPDASLALLVGDTMAGKTFVALDLALRLQHGMEFMGHKVKPCSTIYLPGEGFAGLTSRVLGWMQQHNPDPASAEDRYVLIGDEVPELSSDPLAAAAAMREVIESAKAQKGHVPGLVIVDTLSQAMTSDENDATATSAVLRVLSDLRHDYGATFLVPHHTRKQQLTNRDRGQRGVNLDDARGSSTLTRNADTVLAITATDEPTTFELMTLKQKGGRCGFVARFARVPINTNRTGGFGEQESTCILVQRSRPTAEALEDRKRRESAAQREEEVGRIVEALNERGPDGRMVRYSSRDTIARKAGMKLTNGRDAIQEAINRGLVINSGTTKSPSYHRPEPDGVPEDVQASPSGGRPGRPGVAAAVLDPARSGLTVPQRGGGESPHTPRDVGTSSAGADASDRERPTEQGRRGDVVGTSGRPTPRPASRGADR